MSSSCLPPVSTIKNGCYYISYEESESHGFEGSRTTLKVDKEDMVT